jgi:ribosomal peptide maturation radical SAM protein 1
MTAKAMNCDVALINMPFSAVQSPSLALGLLKAALLTSNTKCDVFNLNLQFARVVDPTFYDKITSGFPLTYDLTGEWIFGSALWGGDASFDAEYVQQVLLGKSPHHESEVRRSVDESFINSVLDARSKVDAFLSACLDHTPWDRYRLVGFTSVFQQHVASLALARRLKQAYPHLYIVFGGANCEATMGKATLNAFKFIDAVCVGEGDRTFPELVKRVLSGAGVRYLPGFLHREEAAPPNGYDPTAYEVKMDDLPDPDYDEFFAERRLSPNNGPARLLFESSRGCWWGEKSHCTFCGLNGNTIKFRQKNAKRALEELTRLLDRYGMHTRCVSAVDNIIPHNYLSTFLPMLKELEMDLDLFYETKANLRKDQIELYRSAGLKEIQPGIESLSTPILRLMRKGISGIQNIQMLRLCRQYGIYAHWNYLVGFPLEQPEYYDDQAGIVRSIRHLTPPRSIGRIRFDRFSPYLTNPVAYGLSDVRPYPSYYYFYRGLNQEEVANLAYYFTAEYEAKSKLDSYTNSLRETIEDWQAQSGEYALFSAPVGDCELICDLREPSSECFFILSGVYKLLYTACDQIVTASTLMKTLLGSNWATANSSAEFLKVIGALEERRLIIREDNTYLNLPVPLGYEYSPEGPALQRFSKALEQSRRSGSAQNDSLVVNEIADILGPSPRNVICKDPSPILGRR